MVATPVLLLVKELRKYLFMTNKIKIRARIRAAAVVIVFSTPKETADFKSFQNDFKLLWQTKLKKKRQDFIHLYEVIRDLDPLLPLDDQVVYYQVIVCFSNFVDLFDLEAAFVPLCNKGINLVSATGIKSDKAIALSSIVSETVSVEQQHFEGKKIISFNFLPT